MTDPSTPSVPETGRQPIVVWKCPECGKVDREQWVGGSHMQLGGSDTTDPEQRCYGQAEGPFYLLSQDEYLDVLLVEDRMMFKGSKETKEEDER